MVQRLVDRLKQRPGLVLLIDGIGAILSAFFLGVVTTTLEPYVGMPRRVLFVLALVALAYGAYSIGGYCLRRSEWRSWLRAISGLNLAYCGATAALVVAFWARLTFIGVTYFLLEILLIGFLVVVERRVLAADDTSAAERRQNDQTSSANSAAPR
jgi:hypothetical protein